MMVSTFFLCLKSTPYYARRKRKKDRGSGIRRNIFRVQETERKRITDLRRELKKNFSV
jgi:peptide methionine sulfoxide reductase MsrA